MSSYQKFAKNIGIVGLANSLVFLQRILLLPFITKILGAESYGIWVQLMITISLLSPLATLGLNGAIVRFLAAKKDRREIQEGIYSVLALVLAATLLLTFLFLLLANPIANFFQSETIVVKIFGFILIFEFLNLILFSFFQAFQEIGKYSFFKLLKVFGEAGLIVAAVLLGYGLFGAVVSLLTVGIIIFLILFGLLWKKIGIKIPNFSPIKEYLRFGLPRVLGGVSYWTVTSADRYLIGFFLGTIFVGYYAPAYTIGSVLNFLIYPIIIVLPAVLVKAFDENKIQEVKIYLRYSLKYFLMIAIPSVFGLSILSEQLVAILSTQEIATNSYYVVPFSALSIMLYGITVFYGQPLYLAKKTKLLAGIVLAAGFLNGGLNLILIPRFGILGAAVTTLLAYILILGVTSYFSSKELQFEINWKFIMKSVLASLVMVLAIIWFSPTGLSEIIMAIILGALLYGILIFLLRGVSKTEIEFLKGFLRR